MPADLVDLSPIARLLLVGAVLATLALLPVMWRLRRASAARRLAAVASITLFLTFDLVLFGAFTRLTDSGLGCPDWPGCYGNASPAGAQAQISAQQAQHPTGTVTHGKAWIEMTHRYLATAVGALITGLLVASVLVRRRPQTTAAQDGVGQVSPGLGGVGQVSPAWAALCFVWVCAQGAFGALTVTWKLYPAIVTGHLLGGIGLLALLAAQVQRLRAAPVALGAATRWALLGLLLLVVAQVTLGGWVSTNYAVLACPDFPTCQGSWWPQAAEYAPAFEWRRELGHTASGELLPFGALVAIHWVHRLGALVVFTAVAVAAWRWWQHAAPLLRQTARLLAVLATWQLASGVSNVVLGWPLAAAVAHTGGAAVLVAVLARALAGTRTAPATQPVRATLASQSL